MTLKGLTYDKSWAIGSCDRYFGIPVLPEVKISTNYLNTNLFKKLPITDYQKWSRRLSVVGICLILEIFVKIFYLFLRLFMAFKAFF